MSVSRKKTSRWRGLQISLHGEKQETKDGSDLREMIMLDSGWHYNQPVWKSKHDHKHMKNLDVLEVSDQCKVKIVDELGKIPGAGQTKFHPEIISNVLGLNEMTKNTR